MLTQNGLFFNTQINFLLVYDLGRSGTINAVSLKSYPVESSTNGIGFFVLGLPISYYTLFSFSLTGPTWFQSKTLWVFFLFLFL